MRPQPVCRNAGRARSLPVRLRPVKRQAAPGPGRFAGRAI